MKKNNSIRVLLYLYLTFCMVLLVFSVSGCGNDRGVEYAIGDSSAENGFSAESSSAYISDDEDREGRGSDSNVGADDKLSSDTATEKFDAAEKNTKADGNPAAASDSETGNAASGGTICVYVCGAVNTPGVYPLPDGSRVYQAVAAAGGMRGDADDRSLNQAQPLSDGQQITVYTREEAEKLGLDRGVTVSGAEASASPGSSGSAGNSGNTSVQGQAAAKVNLNTATTEELMTLPGIGESRAASIIRYREENGTFSSIEDIQNVEGIKKKAFEKLKDYIEV